MTSFKEKKQHAILELLQNRKHKRGHFIVENNGILKKNSQNVNAKIQFTC